MIRMSSAQESGILFGSIAMRPHLVFSWFVPKPRIAPPACLWRVFRVPDGPFAVASVALPKASHFDFFNAGDLQLMPDDWVMLQFHVLE